MNRRVIGQNRGPNVRPLLSIVGNRKREEIGKAAPAVDDPPASTDDEDDSEVHSNDKPLKLKAQPEDKGRGFIAPRIKAPPPHDDVLESSGDDRPARAGIKSTTFGSRKDSSSRSSTSSKPKIGYDKEPDTSLKPSKRKRSDSEANDRAAAIAAHLSQTPPSSADHLHNRIGFVKSNKVNSTYGSRKNPRGSQSSQNSTGSRTNIRKPDLLDSPQKPKSKFIAPDDTLRSPAKERPRFKRAPTQSGSEGTRSPSPAPGRERKLSGRVRDDGKKNRGKKKRGALSRTPSPPPAKFIMPSELSSVNMTETRTESGTASHAAEPELLSDDTVDEPEIIETKPQAVETVCPWCGQPVDGEFLKSFSKGKRMRVQMQTKFCRIHRKKTAMGTWRSSGYPEIEWEGLEQRLSQHHGLVLNVINGGSSLFRNKLAANIEAGTARSMKKEENLNPGYYGPRGFNLMCDYLVREFGDLLKQKAVDDRVIAGRGSAAFIQSVLVAELAVQLIMEDMDAGVEQAREIMEESKALGEIVHDE